MLQVVEALSYIDVPGIVATNEGGTSASSIVDARRNLNMAFIGDVGKVGGPIRLDANGLVSSDLFETLSRHTAELDGPETINPSGSFEYKITNFDARVTYTLIASVGSVQRNHDTITYIAPSTISDRAGFSVNGEFWSLTMTEAQARPAMFSAPVPSPIPAPPAPPVVTPPAPSSGSSMNFFEGL